MNAFVCSIFLSILLTIGSSKHFDDDYRLKIYVADCLAETGLNISILGITKIDDLREESFRALGSLDEENRNCFVACVFQKRGIITLNRTLTENLPSPDPSKKFATNYEDAINACRAEKKFCRLGGCLYEIYY